jgi:hypothetical protein
MVDMDFVAHWPDAALAGVVAFGFWLLQRAISAGDARHKNSAAELKEHGKQLGNHETRIAVVESKCQERYWSHGGKT